MTEIIDTLDQIADRYDAAFVDLWGCLHNGERAFPEAVEALRRFISGGGYVILLTNAPRPKHSVEAQIAGFGVPRDCWHEIVTSGDSAKAALASGAFGRKVYHLGPPKDESFFEPDPDIPGIEKIERVPLDQAESVVCTGLFDDFNETPEDYAAILLEARNRGLPMLCANPDIVVDYGDKRIYCAGAICEAYRDRGGEVHYFGKPHPPIYDLARRRLTHVAGRVIPDARILAIGDGIGTDIAGAMGEGFDSLFITGGLAAEETGTQDAPDPKRLEAFLQERQISPTYAMGRLR